MSRGDIQTALGTSVCQIVFGCTGHAVLLYLLYIFHTKTGGQIGVLSVIFFCTSPAWITGQINIGSIGMPDTHCGRFPTYGIGNVFHQFFVKRSA